VLSSSPYTTASPSLTARVSVDRAGFVTHLFEQLADRKATEDKATMHDLHATLLGLIGLDHRKWTYPFQGRDFRLTDVGSENDLTSRLIIG
jgi:hypothetical protein